MNKQEVIRKAYGEYWEQVKDYVDQYGRLTYQQCWDIWKGDDAESHFYKVILEDKALELRNDYEGCYQPKSLQGIENNNGWIKIESEADLPIGLVECYVYDDDVDITYFTFNFSSNNDYLFIKEQGITHYQPIIKPLKPIY